MTHDVKDAFLQCNTEVDYIPKGYTSKLQPLDVGVNGPFKRYIRNAVELFLMENTGEKVKIHRRNVAQWIADSYDKITTSTMIKAWGKSGYDTNIIRNNDELQQHDIDYDDDDDNNITMANPYSA